MRYIKIAALAFVSMLTVIMAQAGNAAAELLWLVCLPGNGLTKYTNSSCLTPDATLTSPWEDRGLAPGTSVTVRLLALTILLGDTGAKSKVECFMTGSIGEGRFSAKGEGEVTVAEYENAKANCRGLEGCETNGVEEVKGVNLPWVQTLEEGPNGVRLGVLKPHAGGGHPGYQIKCKVLGISVTDTCLEEEIPEKIELFNERSVGPSGAIELLLKGRFENAAKGKCSVGGAKTASLTGLGALLLPGGALSITDR